MTVHCNRKVIEDVVGNTIVDILPILASGNDIEQLLSVPKLAFGIGEAIAAVILKLYSPGECLSKLNV